MKLAETTKLELTSCWCGQTELEEFSKEYLYCPSCHTLVSKRIKETDATTAQAGETGLYSSNYWYEHQVNELSLPDITIRSRSDLPERCVYWLRAVMKYSLPPANVLELGSSHGGFVAMLRVAGYEAMGLELSPEIVDYARKTFHIPVLQGPIEEQNLSEASQDVIILMDVLEHLAQPKTTLEHCLKILKPDGILVIQTPMFPAGQSIKALRDKKHSFLQMLLPDEHLFLFSRKALKRLFTEIGLTFYAFETPFFSQYDMFVIASRNTLHTHQEEETEKYLLDSPEKRFLLALLDKDKTYKKLEKQWVEAERDRARRLQSITKLQNDLEKSETDRAARLKSIVDLEQLLRESEADRATRLDSIVKLEQLLQESEADRAARIESIHKLEKRLKIAEADRKNRLTSIHELEVLLKESEADRAARLEVIHNLNNQLQESEADRAARLEIIHTLESQLQESEADRATRLEIIHTLESQLQESEADRAARLEIIQQLSKQINQNQEQLSHSPHSNNHETDGNATSGK
jgi:2-polyprenyl-3-methyl-5-hydroxy-6-metoxy-1,4-benzoquinol methylase